MQAYAGRRIATLVGPRTSRVAHEGRASIFSIGITIFQDNTDGRIRLGEELQLEHKDLTKFLKEGKCGVKKHGGEDLRGCAYGVQNWLQKLGKLQENGVVKFALAIAASPSQVLMPRREALIHSPL